MEEFMKLSGALTEKGIQFFDGAMRYHAGHLVTRLWIVVANQKKARIYRKIITDGIELIATAQASADEKFRRPPEPAYERMHAIGQSPAKHAPDACCEQGKIHELKFVQKLAVWLNEAQKEDAFDRLVLVAAPKTLSELRPLLSEGVQARLMAQLDKDLASQADYRINEQLEKIIWF